MVSVLLKFWGVPSFLWSVVVSAFLVVLVVVSTVALASCDLHNDHDTNWSGQCLVVTHPIPRIVHE